MLRSDSVVDPASEVVSRTICVWIRLMRRLRTELRMPSSGTVARYTGAMSQWTLNAYSITKTIPTSVVNSRLTAWEISFSTSDRTFWRMPSVSPLRWSSNTWYGSASECLMPSA